MQAGSSLMGYSLRVKTRVRPVDLGSTSLDLPGFQLVFDDQFGSINSSRIYVYDISQGTSFGNFGSPTRVQTYLSANAVLQTGVIGANGGTALALQSKEIDAGSGTLPTSGSAGTRYSYTAAMFDTKNAGWYGSLYGRWAISCAIPHGQGLWAAPLWLSAKATGVISPYTGLAVGGSTIAEFDGPEYFHAGAPGRISTTLHRSANNGQYFQNAFTNNSPSRTFFEAPTYTPAFHEWAYEIEPVTDGTGTTRGDITQPSTYVRFICYLDGVEYYRFVDTSALWWTTNGGSVSSFWNLYSQGCEIDGNYVGHPRSPLGYSHWLNQCIIGGTAPNSCTITSGGYTVQQAVFTGGASDLVINYLRNWTAV